MSTETEHYEALPAAIVERLRAREHRVALLTPAVDRAIEAAARDQFAPRRLRPAAGRRWWYPAAVAAAVALVALFVVPPYEQARIESQFLADDVDGSGRVDILDAFVLARARAGDPEAVSQERIDELAERIVSLDPSEAVL
jgi:hypothetical protein